MLPNLILCAFLLFCFDKQVSDEFCAKGCTCYKEPDGQISAICKSDHNQIDSEFPRNSLISSLAFIDNNQMIHFDKLFPVTQIVKNLIIIDSQYKFWSTDNQNLFKHIKQTEYLTLIKAYLTGWEWDKLAVNLDSLEGIHLQECTFTDVIPATIGKISTDKVIILSIVESYFNGIETKALRWPNLRKITITGNHIPKLNREWFEKYLNDLWSLDLHSNGIEEIPEGFFNGMPNLRQLKLNDNHIKTLTWKTIGVVWKDLHEFWITGNLIVCSKDLSWIAETDKYPLFFGDGQCRHAGHTAHDIKTFYRVNNPIDVDLSLAS